MLKLLIEQLQVYETKRNAKKKLISILTLVENINIIAINNF